MSQQYFIVYNQSSNRAAALIPFHINKGQPWVTNFNMYSQAEQVRIFEEILDYNGWDPTHTLVAEGDYGNILVYMQGVLLENKEEPMEE